MLDGKVAVVTGGARGIGLSVGERFAAEGALVVLADLDADEAAARAAELSARGGTVTSLALDVTDEASVAEAVSSVRRDHGGADVVVANAGVLVLRHVVDTGLAEWQRILDVNLTGVFLTCRGFARDLLDRGAPGRIVISSSLFGRRGGVENGAYSATKFGVLGLMESLAAELAPHGVLVNAVCPGQIATDMNTALLHDRAALLGVEADTVLARLLAKVPLGRLGTPEEVADAYLYLASDLGRYVTGQTLTVDGGWEVG